MSLPGLRWQKDNTDPTAEQILVDALTGAVVSEDDLAEHIKRLNSQSDKDILYAQIMVGRTKIQDLIHQCQEAAVAKAKEWRDDFKDDDGEVCDDELEKAVDEFYDQELDRLVEPEYNRIKALEIRLVQLEQGDLKPIEPKLAEKS